MKNALFRLAESSGINACMRRIHRGKIKVLLYHNVTPGARHFDNSVSPEEFERHVQWLKQHCNIVEIGGDGQWHGLSDDRVNVLLTFDDGFINNIEHVLPILVRHRVRAVFFLIASLVETGAAPWFVSAPEEPQSLPDPYRTLTAAQARMLLDAGMRVGSHGVAHDDYRGMDEARAMRDAQASRSALEDALGTQVRLFAFPWGFHTPAQLSSLAGVYARIFLTRVGFARADMQIVPRNAVANLDHLRVVVSGTFDALIERRNRQDGRALRLRDDA